ncbi:MAG TPA: Flp family type IVb pilin [Roseiarcus sp.]|nr:Flp family type IVb pilin [Roseiarcus sp.]
MPVTQAVQAFVRDEGGATAIEYALIASLISVFCITVFQTVGGKASNTFNAIANTLH